MKINQMWAGILAATVSVLMGQAAIAQDADAQMDAALAQLQQALPGELLNNPFTTKWSTDGNRIRGKIVKSEGAPGGAAFEVKVRERFPEVWEARVKVPLEKDIAKGDEIEVAMWVRAEKPMYSLGTGNVDFQVVRNKEPYDNIFSVNLRPTTEWQLLTARGTAGANFEIDDTLFGVNIGYGKQTLQFGTVYMLRLSTAAQREAAAAQAE